MTVTIPVSLTSEEQATLITKANLEGVSVDSLLRTAVLNIISAAQESMSLPVLSTSEFDCALEEIAEIIPPGSHEALRRENIYTREDEWNRR